MRLVDVYPYRLEQNEVHHLILKRSAAVVYSQQWRMVGGKVKEGEKAYETALRELKEETGLAPSQFWTLPSVNSFYEHKSDTIYHIPAFGARLGGRTKPKLNHEHSEWQWIKENEIDRFIVWPEQRRLMRLLASIIKNNQILEEWIIEV